MSDQKPLFNRAELSFGIITPRKESPKVVIPEQQEVTKDLKVFYKIRGEILKGVYLNPKAEILR